MDHGHVQTELCADSKQTELGKPTNEPTNPK